MFVKYSRAGSRLIHACPCVGLAPKGTPCEILAQVPVYVHVYRTTITRPGVRELVAGDNSLFVVGLGQGKEICSGFSSRSTRRGLFIMRIERAAGDKDPVCSFPPPPTLRSIPLALLFVISQTAPRTSTTLALCVILFLSRYRH